MIYFSSDTHFSHANVIKYCNRPFADVEEMNEAMVERWNARVCPGDVVYHLGDFALGPSGTVAKWRARLYGTIHLALGNHDRSATHMEKAGFLVTQGEALILPFSTSGTAARLPPAGVREGEPEISRLYLSHRPPQNPDPAYVYLHGHVHETYARRGNLINVGVDVRGFAPATLEELLEAA